MKRPVLKDYLIGVSQMEFGYVMNKYHADIERYIDYLEESVRLLNESKDKG